MSWRGAFFRSEVFGAGFVVLVRCRFVGLVRPPVETVFATFAFFAATFFAAGVFVGDVFLVAPTTFVRGVFLAAGTVLLGAGFVPAVEFFCVAVFFAAVFLPADAFFGCEPVRGFAGVVAAPVCFRAVVEVPVCFRALVAVFACVVVSDVFRACPAVAGFDALLGVSAAPRFDVVAPCPVFVSRGAGLFAVVLFVFRSGCAGCLPVVVLLGVARFRFGEGRVPRTGVSSFIATFECRLALADGGSTGRQLRGCQERCPAMLRLTRFFAALRAFHARKVTDRRFEAVVASFDPSSMYSVVAQELAADDCYAVDVATAGTLERIRSRRSRLESSMRHGAWVSAHFADGSALWLASPSMLPGRGFCLVGWFPARSYVELRFARRGKQHTVWADAVLLSPFRRNMDGARFL